MQRVNGKPFKMETNILVKLRGPWSETGIVHDSSILKLQTDDNEGLFSC